MKPVIIIGIAVVCSVVAVLCILFTLQEIANMELKEYQQDLNIRSS